MQVSQDLLHTLLGDTCAYILILEQYGGFPFVCYRENCWKEICESLHVFSNQDTSQQGSAVYLLWQIFYFSTCWAVGPCRVLLQYSHWYHLSRMALEISWDLYWFLPQHASTYVQFMFKICMETGWSYAQEENAQGYTVLSAIPFSATKRRWMEDVSSLSGEHQLSRNIILDVFAQLMIFQLAICQWFAILFFILFLRLLWNVQ